MAAKDQKVLIEPKKDEFKVYLEKTRISDQLANILISLYEEPNKPENVEEFITRSFQKKDDLETVYLKNEVLRLRDELSLKNKEIEDLKAENIKLKEQQGNEEFN